jgi:NADH-quinone oxidoreductase subunit J
VAQEKKWLNAKIVVGPVILTLVLAGELLYMLSTETPVSLTGEVIGAKAVGMSLYGQYVIGVELSGILLMAGIVGAYHLGRQKKKVTHRFLEKQEE